MSFEHQGRSFIEPQDLKVKTMGFLPQVPASDAGVREALGRDFLGPDEIVALIQVAVARSVDYQTSLSEELVKIRESGKDIKDAVFRKNMTGIGRGHSMEGLAMVALGMNGTKMIDSAFTGVAFSRSLVTSGRRRATTSSELVVPRSISSNSQLFQEYLEISDDLFTLFGDIKERFGRRVDAIQAFNKLKPYNDPADLFYLVPLGSLVNLAVAVDDERRAGTAYLPEEFALFADQISDLVEEVGMGQIYRMRRAVPRETYLHYNIFRAPEADYASSMHDKLGNPIDPAIVRIIDDLPDSARNELVSLQQAFRKALDYKDSRDLYAITQQNRALLSSFCRRYNEALNIQTTSTISWRVWSEQKRHATLKQHVESIYSAAARAVGIVNEIWDDIENVEKILAKAEEAFIIENKIKAEPEMLKAYIYHTARQIRFYGKLVDKGIDARDALYIVPRNIRMRTLESYDLINALSLEMPLRLCTECEPERMASSEKKACLMKEQLPHLSFLIEPKCNLGYCTEGAFCGKLKKINPNYNLETHKAIAEIIAEQK